MGEPAIPTAAERKETRELAVRIVNAVCNDEPISLGLDPGILGRAYVREDVEQLAFRLAQEIGLLLDDRHERADALVATAANVESAMDDARELLELLANKLHEQQREAERSRGSAMTIDTKKLRDTCNTAQSERLDHISTLGQAGELEQRLAAIRAALKEACEIANEALAGTVYDHGSAAQRINELRKVGSK